MKRLLLALIFLPMLLAGQSPDWAKIVTDEVLLDARGSRVYLADVNGDGYPDLLMSGDVGAVRNHIFLYLNLQRPGSDDPTDRVFGDFTEESGIQARRSGGTSGRIADVAALADIDNDGDIDLITSIYTHRIQDYTGDKDPGDRTEVLLNDGTGRFTLLKKANLNNLQFDDINPLGLPNTTSIAFLDYDKDGKLDLYLGTWFSSYVGSSQDRFMQNLLLKGNGDGTFEFVRYLTPVEPLYGATVFDFNNDGWTDIFTSPYCRTSGRAFQNTIGNMIEVSSFIGYDTQRLGGDHGQNLCQWEALPGDFDNDGDLDLLEIKVHGGYNEGEGRSTIAINGGAESGYSFDWDLSRIKRNANIENHLGDMGGAWFDFDNDGKLDMAICQSGYLNANAPGDVRLYLLLQDENGYFIDKTADLGLLPEMEDSHSIEPADYDLDGDLDLFVSSMHKETVIEDGEEKEISYMRIELIENRIGSKNHWVAFKLNPPAESNRDGLGTRIYVYSGDEILTRELQAGGGHFGYQSPFMLHFGLSDAVRIDSVKVRWNTKSPDRTVFTNLPTNQILQINEDGIESIYAMEDVLDPMISMKHSLDFETVDVGSHSSLQVEITNVGDEQLIIDDISVESDGNVYQLATNISLPVTIERLQSYEFAVIYSPVLREENVGKLIIKSNAGNALPNGEYRVRLSGEGFQPKPIIGELPEEIRFANTWIDASDTYGLKITNIGEEPLTISDMTISSDSGDEEHFELEYPAQGTPIAAGKTLTVFVLFQPKAMGEYAAKLTISHDAYNAGDIEIDLFGVCDGPKPVLAISSLPLLNFGAVQDWAEKSFTVKNLGNADLEIYDMPISDNTEEIFVVDTEYPVVVTPDATREITVIFSPKALIEYESKLSFEANVDTDKEITLRGRGAPISVRHFADGKGKISVELYPVPVTDQSTLTVTLDSETQRRMSMYLVDINGRYVSEVEELLLFNGENHVSADFSRFQAGTYFIVLRGDGAFLQIKAVKQ